MPRGDTVYPYVTPLGWPYSEEMAGPTTDDECHDVRVFRGALKVAARVTSQLACADRGK